MDLNKILPKNGPPINEVTKYIEKYKNDLIVIKYGGNVFIDRNIFDNFITDINILNKLGLSVVVIHGGGPRIKRELEKSNIQSKFIRGLRVTDKKIIGIVESVLIDFNDDIVNSLEKKGSKAISIHTQKNNIIEMSKPVIASINGPAAGVGASIAMACDLRIMSKDAYILSVFSNIALVPDGGLSWMLTRFLGYAKAYEYAIEAKKIDSEVCLKYGIANKVVEKNNLKEETLKWANELIKRPSQSLSLTKKLMRESFNNSFWEIYAKEAEIQNNLTKSEQNHEAVKAFFEKRKPNFD